MAQGISGDWDNMDDVALNALGKIIQTLRKCYDEGLEAHIYMKNSNYQMGGRRTSTSNRYL